MLALLFNILIHSALASETATKAAQKLERAIGACPSCKPALTRTSGDHPLGAAEVEDVNGRKFEMSVMNDEFALKIFQEMTEQGKIPFGFPEDGCYARAHEMSYQLDKKKIYTGKVFATGNFRVDHDKTEKGAVTWQFHVAPVVIVDDGKAKRFWVIDPSLFYEPTTLASWLEALTAHPKSRLKEAFVTNRFIYVPRARGRKLDAFDRKDLDSTRAVMKKYLRTDQKRAKQAADSL